MRGPVTQVWFASFPRFAAEVCRHKRFPLFLRRNRCQDCHCILAPDVKSLLQRSPKNIVRRISPLFAPPIAALGVAAPKCRRLHQVKTWRTEEAPRGWGGSDHGAAADPILCSLESGKAALSPADWLGSPIESARHSWRN
jgi:hypothetical protein